MSEESSDDFITSLVDKYDKISSERMKNISSWAEAVTTGVKNLRSLTKDLPPEDLEQYQKSSVVGGDGSIVAQEYSSVVVALASACSYPIGTKSAPIIDSDVVFTHPFKSNIVGSLRMKYLEYKEIFEVLKKYKRRNGENPDAVFIDGTLTFPDNLSTKESPEWVKNEFEDQFIPKANDFFRYLEKEGIPAIAISKDPTANKYFTALELFQKKSSIRNSAKTEVEESEVNKIINWLTNAPQNFHELSMMRYLFENKTFLRTELIEVSKAIKNTPLPIKPLRGQTYGFYYKTTPISRVFYSEVFLPNTDRTKVWKTLVNSSVFSPLEGYPAPLYINHHLVKLRKSAARKILSHFKWRAYEVIKEKQGAEIANVLFKEKMREELK